MKRLQLDRKICMIILAACAVLVVLYKVLWSDALVANEVLAGWVTDAEFRKAMLDTMVMDTAGFIVFICMTIYMGYRVFNPLTKPIFKSFLFVLPSLAVAINNFPLIGLATGAAYVTDPPMGVVMVVLYCLSIGLFEEFAFRGLFYLMVLDGRYKSTKQIFWTTAACCAVFGLVHLVNLAVGAGVGATVMQVGYSFLIGGMCAIVLLKTANIWYCVLLHTVFDVGGTILYLGGGKRWDTATVVITAVLAVIVTVFMLISLLRIKPEDVARLFPERKNPEEKAESNE